MARVQRSRYENRWPGGCAPEPVLPTDVDNMQTQTLSSKRGVDVQPVDQPTVDLDKTYARAYDGGTAILAPTIERTGAIKRYGTAIPLATAGVSSETDLRRSLREHGHDVAHVRHALRVRLHGDRAAEAVRIAESNAAAKERELI